MKNLIVYNSDCGSGERYANMLANNLHCNCQSIKKGINKSCDNLIFITNIKMNKLQKIKKMLKFANKNNLNLIVLGVGITKNIIANNYSYEQFLKSKNQIENKVKFFYLQGKLDIDKIKRKMDRFLINIMYKNMQNSNKLSEADKFFINCYENKVDFVKEDNLAGVLQYILNSSCKN